MLLTLHKIKYFLLAASFLIWSFHFRLLAQEKSNSQIEANRNNLPSASTIISALPARNVGFSSSGRMSALAVYEKNPNIFYVASGNGGVLKTTTGGQKFNFVFDKQGTANIGALAVSQKDPNLIWVGTGECWLRNSVGRGDGIYKSVDGGKVWMHLGLEKTQTIGKIVIDPTNDNIVFVAALGSTWGYNNDRGIYKTKDGGKTWKKVIYLDERSSGTDIIIDPRNPKNMLAALWDKVHRPYGWFEWGPGSGIYRSTDEGETWKKITKGLPTEKVGRICMDYFRKDPRYVAAVIEEPSSRGRVYRSKDGGHTWQMMKGKGLNYARPYYNHLLTYHPTDVNCFYYSNFNTYTTDGGDTWTGSTDDFHALWINPSNPKQYLSADDHSVTGITAEGNSFEANFPPLDQVYGIGYDMRKLYWVVANLQDIGGMMSPTQTPKGTITAADSRDVMGAEGGKPMMDPTDWTIGYSFGNGGFSRIDLRHNRQEGCQPDTCYYYFEPKDYEKYKLQDAKIRIAWNLGSTISPWNSHILYFGGNFLYKSIDAGDHWEKISPDLTHNKAEWQMPDDGKDYHGDESGSREYQTIRTVSESPLKPGMIWVGTDDGYVWLTKDGGKSWENLTKNISGIPEFCWVSHVYSSRFTEGRCYVTFDNHRNNDNTTYVYVTEDYGKTWSKITSNLPNEECCFVIKEGLKNPDLLYLGTEFGLWISLDRGQHWDRYQDFSVTTNLKNMSYPYEPERAYFPTVAVHDLEIHPRELDLIIGTHGRGAWIMPARALEEMTVENRNKEVYFTRPGNVYLFPSMGATNLILDRRINLPTTDNTQPGTFFCYYLKKNAQNVTLKIMKASGEELDSIQRSGETVLPKVEFKGKTSVGLNTIFWKMENSIYSQNEIQQPGDYRVVLTVDGKEYYQTLHVEDASDEVISGGK